MGGGGAGKEVRGGSREVAAWIVDDSTHKRFVIDYFDPDFVAIDPDVEEREGGQRRWWRGCWVRRDG